jgi:hypothetical protein
VNALCAEVHSIGGCGDHARLRHLSPRRSMLALASWKGPVVRGGMSDEREGGSEFGPKDMTSGSVSVASTSSVRSIAQGSSPLSVVNSGSASVSLACSPSDSLSTTCTPLVDVHSGLITVFFGMFYIRGFVGPTVVSELHWWSGQKGQKETERMYIQ